MPYNIKNPFNKSELSVLRHMLPLLQTVNRCIRPDIVTKLADYVEMYELSLLI